MTTKFNAQQVLHLNCWRKEIHSLRMKIHFAECFYTVNKLQQISVLQKPVFRGTVYFLQNAHLNAPAMLEALLHTELSRIHEIIHLSVMNI